MYEELLARNVWRAFFAITEALGEVATTNETYLKVEEFERAGEEVLDDIFERLRKERTPSEEDEADG